jgi:hypothetical protein
MGTLQPTQPPSFSLPRREPSKTKRIALSVFLVVVVGIVLWSLGKGAYHNYRLASAAVEQLHQRLDQGDYETIYGEATEEFRRAGSRADEIKFLEMVHQKMGNSGKTSFKGFDVNWQNGQVTVNQVVDSQFTLGQAQEGFIWVIEQNQARLKTYRIDSSNLR